MKINNQTNRTENFKDVKPGTIFSHYSGIYMKIQESGTRYNAIQLAGAFILVLDADIRVVILDNAVLEIK